MPFPWAGTRKQTALMELDPCPHQDGLFLLFSSILGHLPPDLQQNSSLCLRSPAFSKYSHSLHASSFLIFSILHLFILKRSFVTAHTNLGNYGGRLASPQPGGGGVLAGGLWARQRPSKLHFSFSTLGVFLRTEAPVKRSWWVGPLNSNLFLRCDFRWGRSLILGI